MKKSLLCIFLILAMSKFVDGQISYVTPAGAGLKTGTDWLNAYDNTQLQKAIDEVANTEVWVAAGTYKAGDAITSYFSMRSGVAIYGGFAGTEPSRDARNWGSNVTILSAERGDPTLKTDNAIHVIYNDNVNSSGILDGFTITGGFNEIGTGDAGGGIFNLASSPTINNCIITKNISSYGGGVFNSNSSAPLLTNCMITENDSRRGGAICNSGSSATLINCQLTKNTASINGGAIFNEGSTSLPKFINCTIVENTAATYGGAVDNELATMTISNSIIWGNTATTAGSQFFIESGSIIMDYSCYQNSTNSVGINPELGGTFPPPTHSIVLDPLFGSAGGRDFLIAGNSPCLDAGLDSYNSQQNDLRGAGYARKLNKADGTVGTIDMGAYEYKFGEDPAIGATYNWVGTNQKESQLIAYPIRNTEIRLTGSLSKLAIATLYDIQGKIILVKNLEEGSINSIRTPNLKSGIYLLTVKDPMHSGHVQQFKIPVTQ